MLGVDVSPAIITIQETETERIEVWGKPGQIVCETPISKITKAKWTGGMTQVVECKALSSNPNDTQKKVKSR
jgi:hypothetical protein